MTGTIYMVGARGAGKTTIGRALAQALGWAFTDTDVFMQQQTQLSVAEMVAKDGWPGFRRNESLALHAVSKPSTVVATGGGMVLAEENRQFMQQHGKVIYLRSPANVLAQRLSDYPLDSQRPTLTGQPIAEEMQEVLAAREALYLSVADFVLDGTAAPQQVVANILQALSLEHVKP